MRELIPPGDGAMKAVRPQPEQRHQKLVEGEETDVQTANHTLTQRLQQQYGHDLVSAALGGQSTSDVGILVLAEWALATAGLDSLVDGPTGSPKAVFDTLHTPEWAATSTDILNRHEGQTQSGNAQLAVELIRRSRGQRLPADIASRLSAALGTDISGAIIHTDSAAAGAAAAINAHAFATGNDVFFAAGAYQPGSRAGDELLAHELTHVVQDAEGRIPSAPGGGMSVSSPSSGHEREAVAAGRDAVDSLYGAGSIAPAGALSADINTGAAQLAEVTPSVAATNMLSRDASLEQTTDPVSAVNTLLEATKVDAAVSMIRSLSSAEAELVFAQLAIPQSKLVLDALVDALGAENAQLYGMLDSWFQVATNRDTLEIIFEARYGVRLGSDGDLDAEMFLDSTSVEQTFDAEGIKKLYEILKLLPPEHVLSHLSHIMTEDTHTVDSSSGYAQYSYLELSYSQDDTSQLESGEYTDENDRMRGLEMMTTTAIHEIAHLVDADEVYSANNASFMALFGWEKHDMTTEGLTALLFSLEDHMAEPYAAELTSGEKDIAHDVARELILLLAQYLPEVTEVEMAMERLGYDIKGGESWRSAEELTAVLSTSHLFYQIQLSASPNDYPWEEEPMGYTTGREYHRAYSWQECWWSYATRGGEKMSRYQWRSPGETFAELYAIYHITEPKGSRLTAAERAWFEGQGLQGDR